MKIQIDLKSAARGLIIGVAAMFALGADSSSSNPVGKYQIAVATSAAGADAIMVDTQTGKAWGIYPGDGSLMHGMGSSDFFNAK